MEVAILTYLASAAKCEWGLTTVQQSVLTSSVFAGMCVGAPVFGALSDAKGRRFSFGCGMLITCVFGFASAAAPNFAALLAFRALVGFGIPSACVAFNWLGETCPASTRGLFLVGIEGAWTAGTVAQALLAYALLNRFGWRVMLTVSATPTLLLLVLLPLVPESPRYLAVQGRTDEAEAVLRRILRACGKAPPPGRLRPLAVPPPPRAAPSGAKAAARALWRARALAVGVAGGLRALFSRSLWLTTLVLVFVWMSSAHVYYALAVLVGQIDFMSGGSKACDPAAGGRLQIPAADLQANLITACAEVPGLALSLLAVHLCSRRVAFAAPMAAVAVVLVPLMAGVSGASAIAPLFLARMLIYSAFAIVWTTAEVYPTSVRGFALGFNNSMSRIGGLLASFTVAARETAAWAHAPEAVLAALSLASAAAMLALPQPDAKGAHLADTVGDVDEARRRELEEEEERGAAAAAAGGGRRPSSLLLARAFGAHGSVAARRKHSSSSSAAAAAGAAGAAAAGAAAAGAGGAPS
jgi:MFS family permease